MLDKQGDQKFSSLKIEEIFPMQAGPNLTKLGVTLLNVNTTKKNWKLNKIFLLIGTVKKAWNEMFVIVLLLRF